VEGSAGGALRWRVTVGVAGDGRGDGGRVGRSADGAVRWRGMGEVVGGGWGKVVGVGSGGG